MHIFVLLNVAVDDAALDLLVKDVDLCRGKLARTHAALKEQVELGKGAAGRLGDAEVGVDDAEEADAALEGMSAAGKRECVSARVTQKKPV